MSDQVIEILLVAFFLITRIVLLFVKLKAIIILAYLHVDIGRGLDNNSLILNYHWRRSLYLLLFLLALEGRIFTVFSVFCDCCSGCRYPGCDLLLLIFLCEVQFFHPDCATADISRQESLLLSRQALLISILEYLEGLVVTITRENQTISEVKLSPSRRQNFLLSLILI